MNSPKHNPVLEGEDNTRQLKRCDFVRIVPVRFALSALVLSLSLVIFAPALAGVEPRNFDKAALRAEAEAMLLPDPSLNLKPAPNIWKVLGAAWPTTGTIPSYYGTPIPADTPDGCYTLDAFFEKKLPYTLNQLAEFDPSTVPYPIYFDPDWKLFDTMVMEKGHSNWRHYIGLSMSTLVGKAREGNPYAAIKLTGFFSPYDPSGLDARSYFFWFRIADTLTCPGWGFETYQPGAIKEDMRALLGWPHDMGRLGRKMLDGVDRGDKLYLAWAGESALRGYPFVWWILTYIYSDNKVDIAYQKPILEKADATKAYALALACTRLPADNAFDKTYRAKSEEDCARLRAGAPDNGLDLPLAEALAEELYGLYAEKRQRALEEQQRHRREVLPEVNRQIDAWLKEVEIEWPDWLKKEWPEYPEYGVEHE